MKSLAILTLALIGKTQGELFQNGNLWVESPGQVSMGEDTSMYCQLPVGQQITQCKYVTSTGDVWNINGGAITDNNGNPAPGNYQAFDAGTPSSVCGLNITGIAEKDIGKMSNIF